MSELIPEEDKQEITQVTENAIYYFKQDELKHKLLLIEDLDGAQSGQYPITELQSKKRISKTVTLKDNKGILETQRGASTLSATCRALRPWLMIIAFRCAPGHIKAETGSGGALRARPGRTWYRSPWEKPGTGTPGPTGRCTMAVLADASATSARRLAPAASMPQNQYSFSTSLSPPISSRIYPGYSIGVGASMSVVQGCDNDETLAFNALHYGHG